MTSSVLVSPRGGSASSRRSRQLALASVAGSLVLGVFAAYSLVYLLGPSVDPIDFHMYRDAATLIVDGTSPYPWFAYPPLSALVAVPFTALPVAAADFAVKLLLVLGVPAILAVLGVRDWRCYPLALLWAPVNAAVQTGNVTIPLALGAALVWRFRDRSALAGATLGITVAAKFVLWPLAVWLAAVGRRLAAVWAVVAFAAVTLVTWAIVDFRAMRAYPERLSALNEEQRGRGYTFDSLAMDLGVGEQTARVLMAAVAVSLLLAVVVAARRSSQQRSFVLAIASALACSPIVWLHYFALLLVPVAVVRPRLGVIWFVPLAMWGFGAGTGNGSTGSAVVVLLVVVATFALALREAPSEERTGKTAESGYAPTTTPA
jgi:hypothetical protein